RKSVGNGQPRGVLIVERSKGGGLHHLDAEPETHLDPLREARDAAAGTAEDDPLDRRGTLLGAVEVEREAGVADQLRGALPASRASVPGALRLERLDRLLEPDVKQCLASFVQRDAVLLGDAPGNALHAEGRDPREEALPSPGYRKICDVAEV